MKHLYTFLLMFFSGALIAQTQTTPLPRHDMPDAPFTNAEPPSETFPDTGDRAVVWEEDFGGGFPAGWSITDASGICPWRWSTDGSWGFFNGNSGTAGGTAIASTTAANGFLICDPDSANNVTYGQPSGTTYQYLTSHFTTSAIDLTGHPYVKLEFEQFFRYNNTPTLDVSVSTDSIAWTTWNVRGTVQPNQASPNAQSVSLNISAVAGDSATVYVRVGWSSRVYYWMIDDMRIVDAPANDLRLTEVNYSEWFFDTANDFGPLEYTVYPATQLRPFTFKGKVANEGYQTQTAIQLAVEVRDASSTLVHSANGALASLDPINNDTIYTGAWTPTGASGEYTVDFMVSATDPDDVPADNMMTKSYAVSPHVFARDRGVVNGRYNNAGEAYDLGNWFHIVNSGDELYGIDVAIHNDTPTGVLITGTLYDANRDPIATTMEHEIVSADLNANGGTNFITLPFAAADRPALDAASDYLVMVNHFGGASDLFVGVSGVSLPQTSLIYDIPVATWFYVTATPMVRMNMDPAVGLREDVLAAEAGLRIYPVPANEQATVLFNQLPAGPVELMVTDMQGRLVWSSGTLPIGPGRSSYTLNTTTWSEGIYTVSCLSGGQRHTQRLVVTH